MAYGQQDYGMGAEYGYETEEERRRREQEEAARQADIAAMANTGMGLPEGTPAGGQRSLGDIAGAYLNKRVDQAGQRVADVGQVFTDPQAALERRLGMTEDAANTVVRSQQTKTYGDGSQEHTVKTETPPPAAPTAPVAPTPAVAQMPQTQPPAAPPAQPTAPPQAMATPSPVPAQLPAAGPVNPAQVMPEIGTVPTPGPGVQVAGAPGAPMPQMPPAAVAPTTMAAAPTGGQTPAAVAAAPGASVAQIAQQQAAAQPTRPQWAIDLEAAGTDENKLMDIARNTAYPQDVRNDAKEKLKAAMAATDAANRAQQIVLAAAQGDPKAQNQLLQSIKPAAVKKDEGQVTEGSYIRAYLYARLGLNELAKEEQEKILGRSKFGQVIVDGKNFEVETDPRSGRILSARDNEGNRVETPVLNKIRAESAALNRIQTHTGKMQDVTTGEVFYEQTTPTGIRLVDNTGKVYTGSSANLRPFGIGSDISTKNQIQLNELQNRLAFAGPTASITEREKVIAESEAKYGPLPERFKSAVRAGTPLPTGMAPGGAVVQPGAPAAMAAPAGPAPVATAPMATIPGVAAPAAAPAAAPTQPGIPAPYAAGVGGATPAARAQATEIGTAAAKENIQVAGKRSESFNKHIDETITPDAINGDSIASTRKQQFAMFNRPGVDAGKIFGIANGAGSAPGDQRWTMFRDVLLGKVSEPADKIRERAAALGLNPQEQSAVAEYAIANADINAKTLKGTAGPGSVSEAEQKINQARNVDPTQVPMLGGYNAMAQSQFSGDLAKYKGDWSLTSKASNTAQLESDWRKEKTKITQMYIDMAKQRIDYIASMGNTSAAIKAGYDRFPVPEYDANTGTWRKTKPITNYDR